MKKKFFWVSLMLLGGFLFVQPLPTFLSVQPVFHVTEKPQAIMRGTNGSALTINISFGDEEVQQWIATLEKPYPLLFIDVDWAERFPATIRLIQEKNIPTGWLGRENKVYEENSSQFLTDLQQYEKIIGGTPLWFRTIDDSYSTFLLSLLWESKINALSATVSWKGGKMPPVSKGEIIALPHHKEERIDFSELKKLMDSRSFSPIDEVLFGPIGNFQKIPK